MTPWTFFVPGNFLDKYEVRIFTLHYITWEFFNATVVEQLAFNAQKNWGLRDPGHATFDKILN